MNWKHEVSAKRDSDRMSTRVSFQVRGNSPAPFGGNEWAWRSAIAARTRDVASAVQTLPPPDARFAVELVFYVKSSNFERADLDNLAKPVMDTVFLPRNAQVQERSLTGVLFQFDDGRVVRLTAEKRLVWQSEEEGVDVLIDWSPLLDVLLRYQPDQ